MDFLTGRDPATALVARLLPDGIAISIITSMEVVEGILGSRDPAASDRVFRRFLNGIEGIGITSAVADQAAAIRLHLRRQGRAVNERALDLLIAATAIEHDLILVTRNDRDYHDIADLRRY